MKLLSLEDFGAQSIHAKSFIQTTKLCTIIVEIAKLQLERRPINPDESARLTQAMCKWVREVPAKLHLYDPAGSRNKFSRPVSELFIRYFAAIILLQRLQGEVDPQRQMSIQSLIASCIIHLYEEIHFREQTCYFRSMVSCAWWHPSRRYTTSPDRRTKKQPVRVRLGISAP